jgi:beta-RFAP synthase
VNASVSAVVEAPARLHFGVLDLRGSLGRRFGGLGAAIPNPSLLLEAMPAPDVTAEGPDAARAVEYARRFLAHYDLVGGVQLHVRRAIPSHVGLGSGTQLGLAVGRALAELHDLRVSPEELALAVGRGRRSAIGTWAFVLGGFILEGGRRPGTEGLAPLLTRLAMPDSWRYVVALPPGPPGLSGEAEVAAFERLPPPPDADTARVAHLVLMQLLPALVDADLPAFGAALSEVQRITGGWFAPAQGTAFGPGLGGALVEHMTRWGVAGVGQSSWGPAIYGIVDGDVAALELAEAVRTFLGEQCAVFHGGFTEQGAMVTRRTVSLASTQAD